MNTLKLLLLIVLFSALYSRSGAQNSLEIVIRNVSAEKGGTLRVAIFNTEESYLKNPFKGRLVKVEETEVSVVFENMPEGKYAISIVHDENDNKELDRGKFGIPKEGFGFSNNASGAFGPPSFVDASFVMNGSDKKEEIKLKYY